MNSILSSFFERDLRKLIEEIRSFKSEENLWRITGSVKNPAGNLALHIIGGTNHLIGATLAQTGYVRNRNLEFTQKGVPAELLTRQLEDLIALVSTTLRDIDLDSEYPIPFDDATRSNAYVLTQLALHLNYHLGQVNYLRRILEP